MNHAEQAVAEMRPMLSDFLNMLGMHTVGSELQLASAVSPFSDWLAQQSITPDDMGFIVSRIGAFIATYLVDEKNAKLSVNEGRVEVQVPFEDGIVRAFDPYQLAFGVAEQKYSLSDAIQKCA